MLIDSKGREFEITVFLVESNRERCKDDLTSCIFDHWVHWVHWVHCFLGNGASELWRSAGYGVVLLPRWLEREELRRSCEFLCKEAHEVPWHINTFRQSLFLNQS